VEAIENTSDTNLQVERRKQLITGATEEDLVNSGLEDIMINSYQEINSVMKKNKLDDLRTAAFINSIDKIAISYLELGIFP